MSPPSPLRVAVLGAGQRGFILADLTAAHPHLAQIVAVAEPRDAYRQQFVRQFNLDPHLAFSSWQEFVLHCPAVDAVIVTTLDRDHVGPAVACLLRGIPILLEKPIAPTWEEVLDIQRAQANSGAMVAVCHSLRYQPGFNLVKQLVQSGRLGEIRTVDLIEQVGYWHFAHSYIRGNWGNSGRATPLLLAKSCHDLDYLSWLLDVPCEAVASFGQLSHFHPSRAPEGAPARCLDGCPIEHSCAYSAVRQYVQTDRTVWPASVISHEHSQQAHLEALRMGPYGLCVYRADNDVVDHQTVMLEYAQGQTATFTVTGFTQSGGRRLRVHGTEADLTFDEHVVTLRHYASGRTEEMRAGGEGPHGGGDLRVVRHWLEAIRRNEPAWLLTDLTSSLASHAVGFAAELARREKRLVRVAEIAKPD